MSWPYPNEEREGIWGEKTSLENYCEEDYYMTEYVVEFANTLTNLLYLYYAVHGLRKSWRYPDCFWRSFAYVGLAGVGITSSAFHGTMKLYAQWSDDLSMFFATGIILHRVWSYGKPRDWSIKFAVAIASFLTAVAVYHCWAIEVAAHQITFALMVHFVAQKTRTLISQNIKDPELKRRVRKLALFGVVTMLVAYALWIVDNVACSQLKNIRRAIGLPWGFLLELHGWWHVLTAIPVYIYLVITELLVATDPPEVGVRSNGSFAWPVSAMLKASPEPTKKSQ